jgi:hypothetical protein
VYLIQLSPCSNEMLYNYYGYTHPTKNQVCCTKMCPFQRFQLPPASCISQQIFLISLPSSFSCSVVMSLFDLSMKVLMDNIDAIEEVGGVPYLILEPLLQKCSATQLLRLEEFNPHFLEDSDVLWKKHCEKDFKGACPHGNQESWRQLYLSKLSDREERLKNITANIRKREEARKEPVRQVKLAAATRAPGRRRQVSSLPLPSRPSLLNSSRPSQMRAPPTNASKLKKQTMRMVKER